MRRVPINLKGRDFFVGDVHGYSSALWRLLEAVRFDGSVDRLFSTGDLVDRGPDGAELITAWRANPWFHAVMGNHEAMMLAAGRSNSVPSLKSRWIEKGGSWFFDLDHEEQSLVLEAAAHLPLAIEIPHPEGGCIGLIHGELPFGADWGLIASACFQAEAAFDQQCLSTVSTILWGRAVARELLHQGSRHNDDASAGCGITGIQLLVCGHTPMPDSQPRLAANRLFLDTGVYKHGGRLTLAEPATRRYWQLVNDGTDATSVRCGVYQSR